MADMNNNDILGYAVFVAFSSTPDPNEFADYAIISITREWLKTVLERQSIAAGIGHAVIFDDDRMIFFDADYGMDLPEWQKFLMLENVVARKNELIVIPKEYGDWIIDQISDYSAKKTHNNQMIVYPDGKIQLQCWLSYSGTNSCSHVSVFTRRSRIISIFFDENNDYALLFTPDLGMPQMKRAADALSSGNP